MDLDREILIEEDCDEGILIKGLLAQDPTVLSCIAKFGPSMKFQLRRRLGTYLSNEDLDDVFMDASIRVFLKGPKFDRNISKFSTWLYRHVLYCAWTLTQSRMNAVSLEGVTEIRRESIERIAEGSAPFSFEIQKILQQLPERQSEIIRLYYVEGWPIEEIADLFGYKPGTVRSVLCRARKNIRGFLDGGKDAA